MRKGFTLIELLAVIVILAIIAVIAVPIVIDIIEDTKINSVKTSTSMYLKATELYISNAELNKVKINPGTYSITKDGNICIGSIEENKCNGEEIKIDVKGNKPTSGQIIIDGNTKIRIVDALVDGYACSSKKNDFICLKGIKEKVSSENGWLTIETEEDTALSNYRVYGSTIQNEEVVDTNLPEAYQLVEYIESNGTQYIDTGVEANIDNSFEVKAQLINISSAQSIWGARGSNTNNKFQGNQLLYSKTTNAYQFINGNNPISNYQYDTNIHIFYANKNNLYIDNNLIYTSDATPITAKNNVYLFATNLTGTIAHQGGVLNIYYTKIWIDDVLVRNLIPCYRKADGEIGLYDLVNNKFYVNQGEGEFLKGNDLATTQTTSLGNYNEEKNQYLLQLKVVGKNLFNKDKFLKMSDYYIPSINGNSYRFTEIDLFKNETYKISVKRYNGFSGELGYLLISNVPSNSNYTSVSHATSPTTSIPKFKYNTDESGKLYIGQYSLNQEKLDEIWKNTDVQIELGETTTEYEAYKEEKYNIYLDEPLRCVRDVCDYIDFLNGEVVRKIGVESDETLKLLDRDIVEKVDLPNIELKKGVNHIYLDSNILPTKLEVEYYKK